MVSSLRHLGPAAIVLLALAASTAHAATGTSTAALCAPDPEGALRVLVLLPPGQWPAGGFEVRNGTTLIGRITADAAALAALEPADAKALEALPDRARANPDAGAAAQIIISARLLSDWDFARAAGMAAVFAAANAPRSGTLAITPVNAGGQPAAAALGCRIASATPPQAPQGLKAVIGAQGPALSWQPITGKPEMPILSFRAWRSARGELQALIGHAPYLPLQRKADEPAYIDTLAPLEETLGYEVALVDALGRIGARARVQLFAPDVAALKPPAGLQASVSAQAAELRWEGTDNAHTTGYVVERAFLPGGPYELMTPKALSREETSWRDAGLGGGTQYYYRVRAMGPRGDLGVASDPVSVQARAGAAPAAPVELKATAGNTRIRLEWELAPANVAGYVVERRADASPAWSRLNQTLLIPNRYDDALGPQVGGTLYYRVLAVGHDNQQSEPSKLVTVSLRDTVPPLPPRIVAASGAEARVRLEVRAAQPVADSARIFVLRAGSAEEEGLVVGAPLEAGATHYEDAWVEPGQTYWYHLVAYDAAGNRSADSQAVAVRVAAPTLTAPAAPNLRRESTPLPRVLIQFAESPAGLAVVVERSGDGVHWRTIAGPTTDAEAQDLDPLGTAASYRLRYQAADGSQGPASTAVRVAGG